jgi:hypothetical protein
MKPVKPTLSAIIVHSVHFNIIKVISRLTEKRIINNDIVLNLYTLKQEPLVAESGHEEDSKDIEEAI